MKFSLKGMQKQPGGDSSFFRLIPVLLSLVITVCSLDVIAKESEQLYTFEIPSLKVEGALNRVAQQTGHQLLFSVELVEPLQSPAILGKYTVQQALTSLLEGSNLSGRVTERGVIVIVAAEALELASERSEMEKSKKGIVAAFIGLLSAPVIAIDAQGQEGLAAQRVAGSSWSGIEEIVVTAQKRENFAQSTPVALSAILGESLRKSGINDALDINGISPSLTATIGNGQLQLTMRGASNEILTSGVGEAGVAFHSNGVYLGSSVTPLLGFFDIDRMEIMRGPQGTLWGRNSTGGAINVVQNRPTEEFGGYANFEYGSYNTLGLEGAISGSLTSNTQGRLALKHRKSDGYLENKAPGDGDLGDDDTIALRASLNIDLSEGSHWLLAAGYGGWDIKGRGARQEGTAFAPGTLNPTSGTPGELSFAEVAFGLTTPRGEFETYSTNPRVLDKVDMRYFTSELSMDFDTMNLTLISDVRDSDREFLVDPEYTLATVEESFTLFDE